MYERSDHMIIVVPYSCNDNHDGWVNVLPQPMGAKAAAQANAHPITRRRLMSAAYSSTPDNLSDKVIEYCCVKLQQSNIFLTHRRRDLPQPGARGPQCMS